MSSPHDLPNRRARAIPPARVAGSGPPRIALRYSMRSAWRSPSKRDRDRVILFGYEQLRVLAILGRRPTGPADEQQHR